MKSLSLLRFVFALACFVSSASAQVMQEVSVEQARSILKDMKIKFEEKAEEKYTYFDFEIEDYNVTLYRYADSLMLQVHFTDKLKFEDANRWNQSAQFGRVYIDKDNRPWVEADLRFEGGVTKPAVEAFIKRFPEVVDSFVDSLDLPEESSADLPVRTKPASSTTKYDMEFGGFTLWYDAKKWTPQGNRPENGRREFRHGNGQGYAVVINEGIPFPLESFEEITITNARKTDPDARILSRERRKVNGIEVLVLQFQATRAGVLFKFYGYYASNPKASAQVVVYTADSVFGDNEADFNAFLDGLMPL